jgi:hypothetical protein
MKSWDSLASSHEGSRELSPLKIQEKKKKKEREV